MPGAVEGDDGKRPRGSGTWCGGCTAWSPVSLRTPAANTAPMPSWSTVPTRASRDRGVATSSAHGQGFADRLGGEPGRSPGQRGSLPSTPWGWPRRPPPSPRPGHPGRTSGCEQCVFALGAHAGVLSQVFLGDTRPLDLDGREVDLVSRSRDEEVPGPAVPVELHGVRRAQPGESLAREGHRRERESLRIETFRRTALPSFWSDQGGNERRLLPAGRVGEFGCR